MTIAFDRFNVFVDKDGKLSQDAALFIEALSQPQDWIEVTAQGAGGRNDFQNSWVNRTGEAVAAFYRDPFGVVHLKGGIDSGSNATVAFTLPEGYRPMERLRFVFEQIDNPTVTAQITIEPSGTVTPASGRVNGVSLAGMSFRV